MSEPEKQVERTKHRDVQLPERVAERVEQRVPRSDFDSVDEYVTYVLEEVLERIDAETAEANYDSSDEAEVEDRLEALGYLDE